MLVYPLCLAILSSLALAIIISPSYFANTVLNPSSLIRTLSPHPLIRTVISYYSLFLSMLSSHPLTRNMRSPPRPLTKTLVSPFRPLTKTMVSLFLFLAMLSLSPYPPTRNMLSPYLPLAILC